MCQRQRQQRRSRQRRHDMQGRNRPGVVRKCRARRLHGGIGLADVHDAFGQNEVGTKGVGGPKQHGIPVLRLARNQRFGVSRAIEQQIRL